MASKNVIITLYPLPVTKIARLSGVVAGPAREIVLSNITASGYWQVFCLLRAIDADCLYFPVSEDENKSLIPVYKILGMISNAHNSYLVMPDLSVIHLGRGSGLTASVKILYGILTSSIFLLIGYFGALRLLKAPRVIISRKSPQTILYIKQTLWLGLQAGGSIAHTRGVIKGLLSQGRNIDLLSLESHFPISDLDGLRILNSASTLPYLIPRIMNYSQFSKDVINSLISSPFGRYGAIYQRLSPGNFSGVVLSRLRKIPLIIEFNGSEMWLGKNWAGGTAMAEYVEKSENICLKHAHLIVTVSDVLKDELIERGVEPNRIVSYPNGVDAEEFNSEKKPVSEVQQIRTELGVPEDAILLTFVGTFGHWHGVEFLARVMIKLINRSSQWFEEHNVFVCFVGDGVKRQAVEEIIDKCSFKHRFKLTGMVPQDMTPLYMAASDILMSPHIPNSDGSPFFGSPTKLFEYMAAGRPVIASDLFQIGEVLKGAPHARQLPPSDSLPTDEQCGVLVRPKSAKDIGLAIQFLVENPEWRRKAGRNARKRVLSRYTWERHAEEICRGFDEAIEFQKPREAKPTRVLLNALHAKTGGGVTYLKNILPLVSVNPDFEFHLCIHESQTDILPKLNNNVQLHTFNFKQGFWRLPFWEQVEVPKLARKIGADVTFSPANYGPFLAPNSVIMLRNALSVAFVERRPTKLAYWLLVSIGTVISMFMCRRVIAVSNYAKVSNFRTINSPLRNRFSIIPHGVSDAFSVGNCDFRRDGYILAVSDIYVQKNLKNLLYAFDILRSTSPDIKLKIAGRFVDEVYHQELIDIIAEKGLHDHVEFLGGVYEDELVVLYRRCNIFVFPSTIETFGNPLIEAMASGAPIACSNTAAMPEIAGDAALFFDPFDVDDMAAVIGRLLVDQELCQDLSAKALARAKNYSWEKTAECTLDVLYQAASES